MLLNYSTSIIVIRRDYRCPYPEILHQINTNPPYFTHTIFASFKRVQRMTANRVFCGAIAPPTTQNGKWFGKVVKFRCSQIELCISRRNSFGVSNDLTRLTWLVRQALCLYVAKLAIQCTFLNFHPFTLPPPRLCLLKFDFIYSFRIKIDIFGAYDANATPIKTSEGAVYLFFPPPFLSLCCCFRCSRPSPNSSTIKNHLIMLHMQNFDHETYFAFVRSSLLFNFFWLVSFYF